MTSVSIDRLLALPILKAADPEVLHGLAEAANEKLCRPGEVILQEGSTGREVYLVVEGRVEVVKHFEGHDIVLAERGPGDFFGEMGLIEESPRFATIRALQPTRLLEVSETELRAVLARRPALLYEAARVLSSRLREADLQMIADLQSKNQELVRAYRELKEAQSALVEKERLERELELARELQQSILPHAFPTLPGATFAARSRPARQVGGDFYDVIPLDGGRVGLLMADVSDKGMPAALYMALTRSLLRAEARHHASPEQVLLSTHRLLLEMTEANMFVTAFYGVLDLGAEALHYARAGHNYPLLFDPQRHECRTLRGRGIVLGCVERVELEEISVDIRPGELLILYTDGITDANSAAGEFFGMDRLREAICGTGELSPERVCDLVFEQVDRFQAGAVQYDDMALLAVRMG